MSAPAATFSVVVPTRDRADQLRACLDALAAQTRLPDEVIVVDDASVDAMAVRAVVGGRPGVRLVAADGGGPAAARNRGALLARSTVVCFTDDDCRPAPGWLAAVAAEMVAGAQVVAGPTLNGAPGDAHAAASQAITNHLVRSTYDARRGTVAFAPTSNIACLAETLRSEPFDETFPLAAGEDREWCARLGRRGVDVRFAPAAEVHHHQRLTLRSFWRQQVRYGRGAHRFHTDASGRRMQRPGFYAGLLLAGRRAGWRAAALVVVAQVATAVGVASEAVHAARRRRAPWVDR